MSFLRAALSLSLLVGCEASPRPVRLDVRPFESLSCRPDVIRTLEIRPRGDAPSGTLLTRSVELSDAPQVALEPFPPATELVAISAFGEQAGGAPWTGGAVAVIGPTGEGDFALSLLELGEPCLFNDIPASADRDAFAVGLPDARVLVGGGRLEGRARQEVALFAATADRADASALRLAVARAGASATLLDGEEPMVLVLGGGPPGAGDAQDTAEVLRVSADAPDTPALAFVTARRAHGATLLPDGRVFVVGGYDAEVDGRRSYVDTAELLRPSVDGNALAIETESIPSSVLRAHPTVLRAPGGVVFVVGGEQAGSPVSLVEVLRGGGIGEAGGRGDPLRLEPLPIELPARLDAAYVALPGGVAMLGGREEADEWSDAIALLLGDEVVVVEGALRARRDTDALHAIREPRALALPDGQVLVTGLVPDRRDELRPVARVIDPAGVRPASDSIALNVVPEHLVSLPDGSVALVGAGATDFLRLDVTTPLDDPPANLSPVTLGELDQLALDGPGRWEAREGALVARVDGARFDVPRARFRGVDVELELVGTVTVLLTRDAAPPLAIRITDEALHFGECVSPRQAGDTAVVRLEGEALVLGGDTRRTCAASVGGRVGVAVRADVGGGVSRIGLRRL